MAPTEQEGGAMTSGFVYLAGPYAPLNGAPQNSEGYFDIRDNITEAARWARKLARERIPYFCPQLNSASFETIAPDVPREYWLSMDMTILVHAAVLLMLPHWRESSGSKAEKEEAMRLGIPVYTHNMFQKLCNDWRNDALRKPQAETSAATATT